MPVLSDPKDTLAYHQSRVFTTNRSMAHVECSQVASALKEYVQSTKDTSVKPESEALWFYGLNHAVALISAKRAPLEPLPDDELAFVMQYYEQCSPRAVRAFYYLMLICIREARHSLSKASDQNHLADKFGKPVAAFFKDAGSEQGIHTRFLESPPKTTIGTFVDSLRWLFYNAKWSGGYGGKAWGKVTDCLYKFVIGEFSAEVMMDTVWTLCHNNGPIFNKGHLYSCHSGTLVRILDIQRSGQVPQAILSDKWVEPLGHSDLKSSMTKLQHMFPDQIGGYVDWFVVEALGSVHKYPAEKQSQVQSHGVSDFAAKASAVEAATIAAKLAQKEAKKKAEAEAYYFITPTLKVAKIKRAA